LTGEKNIVGRKRHILVDTEGNLLNVVVHRANIQDRDGAYFVFEDIDVMHPRRAKIWADQAYTGELDEYLWKTYQIILESVEKNPNQTGFVVLARRWVVERTLAWLGRYRRLSKDYEHREEYSETWVYLASIGRMIGKFYPNRANERPYIRKKVARCEDKNVAHVVI
jgi:putative transposase